jgi:purine-binding chemotaxis protein CheW
MPRFEDNLNAFFYRPDEDTAGVLDLLPEPSEAPVMVQAEEPREFLAFKLEGETYALPLIAVREIVKVPPLTEVPRGGRHLHGVMHLRGEVLPVYDIKKRLELMAVPPHVRGPDSVKKGSRVVLIKDLEGDGGILVDQVDEVVRFPPSALEARPQLGGDRLLVNGIGRKGERLYILLDEAEVLP